MAHIMTIADAVTPWFTITEHLTKTPVMITHTHTEVVMKKTSVIHGDR